MSIRRIVFIVILLVMVGLYNSDRFMFTFIDKIDNATKSQLYLLGIRNKVMHMVEAFNPTVGNLALNSHDEIPVINVELTHKNIQKLKESISKAEKPKITPFKFMSDEFNQYYKCKIYHNGKSYKSKIKYHGTSWGHYEKGKKSLAFKMKKDNLYDHMRHFSFVIMEEQPIVGTIFSYKLAEIFTGIKVKAELVRVKLNSVDQGLYTLEERINKELLEKNNLSGVDIIKSIDDWDSQYLSQNPFHYDQSGLVHKNNSRKELGQLKKIEELYTLKDYKRLSRLIDVDKFAMNEALRTIFGDYHGYHLSNQKLLYNTSTGKFFPYFRTEGLFKPLVLNKYSFLLFEHYLYKTDYKYRNHLLSNLIVSDDFRRLRNKKYKLILDRKDEIVKLYDQIYDKNIPAVLCDPTNQAPGRQLKSIALKHRSYLLKNIKIIEKYLEYSKAYVELEGLDNKNYSLRIKPDSNVDIILTDISLGLKEYNLTIKDLQTKETKRVNNKAELNEFFKKKKFLLGLDGDLNPVKRVYEFELHFKNDTKIKKFEVKFNNTITNKSIKKSRIYKALIPAQKVYNKVNTNMSIDAFINKYKDLNMLYKDGLFRLLEGDYFVKENIIFPYGYDFAIEKGTKIKLAPNKSILIYGSIKVEGTNSKPVIIENKIKNKPFGVVAAIGNEQTTEIDINYLNLSGGKEATINGAYFSGGLSLYSHKDIKIKNSYIHHNSADDGLNIKNANIMLENNVFNANLADQVDLDFCTGTVKNNKFIENSLIKDYDSVKIPEDENGDGLDFSGSKIIVESNYYDGFLDKGISVGENTKALIMKNEFLHNRSAITAKDQSDIYLYSNIYTDNKINIEMYQKKQIFKEPSVYNINEKYNADKVKKSKGSHYYKQDNQLKLEDINISIIFDEISKMDWIEYE